ncbi:hypothetical protein BC831DRAFT_188476 [Entophlyctis helioformis]|nr:hypothetical protein BC831DRAFT_188476 [Entophlyctis helioformis]
MLRVSGCEHSNQASRNPMANLDCGISSQSTTTAAARRQCQGGRHSVDSRHWRLQRPRTIRLLPPT